MTRTLLLLALISSACGPTPSQQEASPHAEPVGVASPGGTPSGTPSEAAPPETPSEAPPVEAPSEVAPPETPSVTGPAAVASPSVDATRLDLESLALVDRIRALAPFVGGPLIEAQAALSGYPSRVEDAVGDATTWAVDVAGETPSAVVFVADDGRVVEASVVQDSVDAFAVVYGLEDELQGWLGAIEYGNVDHGSYFWQKPTWTFRAHAAEESVLELVIDAR